MRKQLLLFAGFFISIAIATASISSSAFAKDLESGTDTLQDLRNPGRKTGSAESKESTIIRASEDCEPHEIPLWENFDASLEVPDCWSVTGGGIHHSIIITDHNAFSQPNSARFFHEGHSYAILASPQIDLETLNLRLNFKAIRGYCPASGRLYVGTISDPTDGNTFTSFAEFDITNRVWSDQPWHDFIVYIDDLSGTDQHIAFRLGSEDVENWSRIFIDDVSIDLVPDCPEPYFLSASKVTFESAELAWNQFGTAESWNIEWGEAGFEAGSGTLMTGITSKPYLLDGLSDNTAYDYHVQANCGSDGLSDWSLKASFSTNCLPFEVPFSENFDQSLEMPDCWTYLWAEVGGEEGWHDVNVSSYTQNSSPNSLLIQQGSSVITFISPPVEGLLSTKRLSFWGQGVQGDNELAIGVMSDPNDPHSFTKLETIHLQPQWQSHIAYLDLADDTDQYFAFRYGGGAYDDWGIIALDDIAIEYLLDCNEPHKLAADNISFSGAQLSWQQVGEAQSWNLEWGAAGFEPGSGTLVENIPARNYLLTGLDEQSDYAFHVQALCSEGELSGWSPLYAFTTSCQPSSSPIFENFDASLALPECWSIAASSNNYYAGLINHASNSWPNSLLIMVYDATTRVLIGAPPVDVPLNTVAVSFHARTWTGEGSLMVGTIGNPNDPSDFNEMHSLTISASWQPYELTFENYAGDHLHIGFLKEGNDVTRTYLDDILIDFLPPCPSPSQLTVQNLTANGAELSWAPSHEAVSWKVEYGLEGFEQGSGTLIEGLTENQVAISGLEPSTSYAFVVQTHCGDDGFSEWSPPFLFTTPCLAAEMPFFEGFETGFTHNTHVGGCWTQELVFGSGQWMVNGAFTSLNRTPRTGSFNATLMYPRSGWMFHPVELQAGKVYEFEVYARQGTSVSHNVSLKVAYGLEDNASAMTNVFIEQTGLSSGEYQQLTALFSPDESGTHYIGILGALHGGIPGFHMDYISIDDIHLQEGMPCPVPIMLEATNVTAHDALLSWTQTGSANSWFIEYGYAGFEPGTGMTLEGISENSYALVNLEPGTFYDFYVQADCGEDELSEWAGPHTFMTECVVAEMPFFEGFETGYVHNTPVGKCWTQEQVAGNQQWMINGQFTNHNRTPRTGDFNATLVHSNSTWLFYPIELMAGMVYDFEMYARQSSTNPDNASIRVAYGQADNDAAMTDVVVEPTALHAGEYQQLTAKIVAAETGTHYLGILGTINNLAWHISIDDIHISGGIGCHEPTDILISDMSISGAEINWTQMGLADAWNLEWAHSGFEPGHGNLQENISQVSYSLDGLDPGTHYDVYVQAICGEELSEWAGPFTFKTLVEGDNCTNPIDLAGLSQPYYSGTTTNAGNHFSFCDMGNANELIFYMDVDHGQTIQIWQTFNNFSGLHSLRWSGECPGEEEAGCSWHTDLLELTNSTGSTQRVWYIAGGPLPGWQGEFTLAWELITCSSPSGLSADNISTDSAELSWFEPGNAQAWDIEYGAYGYVQGTGTLIEGVDANPYLLTGLSQATRYQFHVRSDCGGGDLSAWAGPFTFDAECDPITIPFSETFDANAIPVCWQQENTGSVTSDRWTLSNSNNAGGDPHEMRARGTISSQHGSSRLVSPAFTPGDSPDLALYFKQSYQDLGPGISFRVQFSSDGTEWTDADFGFDSGSGSISSETVVIPINIRGESIFVSWLMEGDFRQFLNWYIDDVSLYTWSDCPEPYNVVLADITSSSARIGWMQAGEADHYAIEWGLAGFVQGEGLMVNDIPDTSHTLEGLTGNTAYSFYLKAHCDEGVSSEWTGPHTFVSGCGIFDIPFSESFDAWDFPACWSQSFSGDLTSNIWWNNYSSNAGGSPYEMRASRTSGVGLTRLVAPVLNLAEAENPVLTFKHYFNDFVPGLSFGIQSSEDGENWVDEDFSFSSGNGNIGPASVAVSISTRSETTHMAWVMDGNHASFTNWYIDDVVVEELACPSPFHLTASEITTSSAKLGWQQSGNVSSWHLEFGEKGFQQGSGTLVAGLASDTFFLTGLSQATSFSFYVQAVCGEEEVSQWEGPHHFTTQCQISPLPFSENFDKLQAPAIPVCWSSIRTGNASVSTFGNFSYSSPNSVRLSVSGNSSLIFITPQMEEPAVNLRLEFMAAAMTGQGRMLEIGTMSDPGNASSFQLKGQAMVKADWQKHVMYFRDQPADDDFIAFRMSQAANQPDLRVFLDDISIAIAPDCPEPTGLHVAETGSHFLILGWSENGQASSWEVLYGVPGFDVENQGNLVSSDENPTSVTALDPETKYEFYVRAICDESSQWSLASIFQTGPSCLKPAAVGIDDISAHSAVISWHEQQSATTWHIEFGPSGFAQGNGTLLSDISDNPYQLTGLNHSTGYHLYLRSDCGDGDLSEWAGPYSFETPCQIFSLPLVESFDNEEFPPCWWQSVDEGATGLVWSVSNTGQAGGTAYEMHAMGSSQLGTARLVTPAIDLSGSDNPTLEFKHRFLDGNIGCSFKVQSSSDGVNWVDEAFSFFSGSGNIGPETVKIPIANPAETTYIAWVMDGNLNQFLGWYIDDVFIVDLPCPEPYNVQIINLFPEGIILGWSGWPGAASWNLEYGLEGFSQGSGTMVSGIGETSHHISGLDAGTRYGYYVQTDCAGNGLSPWAGPFSFVTPAHGDNCEFALDLSQLTSPFSATTTNASNSFSFCDMSLSKDIIFYHDVENGASIKIWQSFNTFNSRHAMRWGGGCPGTHEIDCINFPNLTPIFWTNATGTTQRVWFIIGGHLSQEGNFVLEWEYSSCSQPTHLLADNVTENKADLDWIEPGNAVSWDIEYGFHGFESGQGTFIGGVTEKPHTLTGLAPSSRYQFHVRSNCGEGDLSHWSVPNVFDTKCETLQLPYSESFDTALYPLCWTQSATGKNGIEAWTVSNSALAGGEPHEMKASGIDFHGITRLVSPLLDLSETSSPILTFKHYFKDGAVGASFKIQTSYDGIVWNDEAFGFASGGGNIGPHTIQIPIAMKSASTYLAWVIEGDHQQFESWHIDDVMVGEIPCPSPYNLRAEEVTTTAAVLSWMQLGEAESWKLEWGPAGFSPGMGTLITDIAMDSYLLDGLDEGTNYGFYLQTICHEEAMSDWAGPFFFKTLAHGDNCYNPIDLSGLEAPYHGSTIKSGNHFSFCGMEHSRDIIFYHLVEAGATLTVWQSNNNFNSRQSMRWGGDCPGEYEIDCMGEPGLAPISWTNDTGSDQDVWFVIGGHNTHQGHFALEWTYISCSEPSGLLAQDISTNSVSVLWDDLGNVNSWDLEYGLKGFTPGQGTLLSGLTNNNYLLSNLQHSTHYDIYVRSECSNGQLGSWAGPLSFTTFCGEFVLPFSENFDMSGMMPLCWHFAATGNQYQAGIETNGEFISAPNSFYVEQQLANTLLSLPKMAESTGNVRIRFWARREYGEEILLVGSLGDQNNIEGFNELSAIILTDQWQEYEVYSNPGAASDSHIGFLYGSGSGSGKMYLDDVRVKLLTDCTEPYMLAASSHGSTAAVLQWTQWGNADSWNVEWGHAGFTPGAGMLIEGIGEKPYLLTGLEPGTEYGFRVQTSCGSSLSEWSDFSGFTSNTALALVADADATETCVNHPVQLSAMASGGFLNYSYWWTSYPPGFSAETPEVVVNPTLSTTYFVEVFDGEDGLTASVFIEVYDDELPQPPVLLTPANNFHNQAQPMVFNWEHTINTSHYDLYVWRADQPKPQNPTAAGLKENSYSPGGFMNINYIYKWQVAAWSPCSEHPVQSEQYHFAFQDFPDLTVTHVNHPDSAVSGSMMPVTFNVSNIGDASTGFLNWIDEVYMSELPVFDPESAVRIGSAPNPHALVSGGGYVMEMEVRLGNQLSGDYYLYVKTDAGSAILETDETNNMLRSANPIHLVMSPYPNLLVRDVQALSDSLIPNRPFSFSWVVENIGDAVAVGGWRQKVSIVNDNYRRMLGYVPSNQSLESSGLITQTASMNVPRTPGFEGDFFLEIELIPNDALVLEPGSGDNNMALSDESIPLIRRLYLDLSASTIDEGSPDPVVLTISRSGSRSGNLVVDFIVSEENRLSLPAPIIIPDQQSGMAFPVYAIDNDIFEGEILLLLRALAEGHLEALDSLTIIDDETASLSVSISESEAEEGETVFITISRDVVTDQALTVSMFSSHPLKILPPASISIAAGLASETFQVQLFDNDIPELHQEVFITARAPYHSEASSSILVLDNDIPSLTFTIMPDTISEGGGPFAAWGTISRNKPGNTPILLTLSAEPAGQVYLPPTLTIPGGLNERQFNIGAIDNNLLDGTRHVEISASIFLESCQCNLPAEFGGEITQQLVIVDNDGPSLSVSADPFVVPEGITNAGYLTISRNTPPDDELSVQIQHSRPDMIDVQPSVLLLQGETSVVVPYHTLDDGVTNDDQLVSIHVAAENYNGGFTYLMVTDRNLPDLIVTDVILESGTAFINDAVPIEIQVSNVGFLDCPAGVEIRVYLSEDDKLDDDDHLMLTTKDLCQVPAQGKQTYQGSLSLEGHVGQHYLIVVVNPLREINELFYHNNESDAIPLTIMPDYSAMAFVDGDVFNGKTPIEIYGHLVGDKSLAHKEVDVYLQVGGTRRVLKTTSDESGNFALSFQPLNGEAGHYTLGACYPGLDQADAQDSFTILGMRYVGPMINWHTVVDEMQQGSLQIKNMSTIPLNGVLMELMEAPPGTSISFESVGTLAGEATASVGYILVNEQLTEGDSFHDVKIRLHSSEGVEYFFYAQLKSTSFEGHIRSNPPSLVSNMVTGMQNIREFVVRNVGLGCTGLVSIDIPEVPWMTLISPATIESIAPGASAAFIFRLSPTPDLPLNVPITGNFFISSENANNISVPFSIETISVNTGGLLVEVVNEYTYNTPSSPRVDGATVILRHPYTGATVAQGITGENGLVVFEEIPEGYYSLNVSAQQHSSYQQNIYIYAGQQNQEEAFISFEAISYSWHVVPTWVDDEYEIELIVTFETNVPKPVVIMDMPETMPYIEFGEVYPFIVTASNVGLVTAEDFQLYFPDDDDEVVFTILADNFDLLPQQSVQIPVIMERRSDSKSDRSVRCRDISGSSYSYTCGPHTNYKYRRVSYDYGWRICQGSFLGLDFGDGGGGGLGGGGGGGGGSASWSSGVVDIRKACDPCIKGLLDYVRVLKTTANCFCAFVPGSKDCMELTEEERAVFTMAALIAAIGTSCKVFSGISCVVDFVNDCYYSEGGWRNCLMAALGCVNTFFPNPSVSVTSCVNDLINLCPEENQPSFLAGLLKAVEAVESAIGIFANAALEILGDQIWLEAEETQLASFLHEVINHDHNVPIALTDELVQLKPDAVSMGDLESFVDRWNSTFDPRNVPGDQAPGETRPVDKRIFNELPGSQYRSMPNVIDTLHIGLMMQDILSIEQNALDSLMQNELAQQLGINSLSDVVQMTPDYLEMGLAGDGESVCAKVSLQFSQSLTMTREAFEGTLTVFNGHESESMQYINLDLIIKNEAGVISNDLFQVNTIHLDKITEINGSGTLSSQTSGQAVVQFIPTKDAAPEVPVIYYFGGTLSYLDPFTNEVVSSYLFPVALRVNPSPDLYLTYFMQRNIFGDDPLTPQVEPSIPGELAVMIHNQGFGEARNVQLDSAQPEIIDNEKGLLIEFEIIGSSLGGQAVQLGLNNVDFGDMAGGDIKIGQWWFTSSLLGHFVSYEATVKHLNSFGNADLSLIGGIEIHELIKSISAYGEFDDGISDFLVNAIPDAADNPDAIYFSDGTVADVFVTSQTEIDGIVIPSDTVVTLAMTPHAPGWNYMRMDDPGNGLYAIVSVIRDDGQVIPLDNIWLTHCTLPDGGEPIYENKLHFVDFFGSGNTAIYTIVFEPREFEHLEVIAINGAPETISDIPVTDLEVVFNKPINPESFTWEDLSLMHQGNEVMVDSLVTIFQVSEDAFQVDISAMTAAAGHYVFTVQAAGITDFNGMAGVSGKQVAWIQAFNAPAVQLFIGVPVAPSQPLDSLMVLFNIPILEGSFTENQLALQMPDGNYADTGDLVVGPVNTMGSAYKIAGLQPLNLLEGMYELTVKVTEITGVNGENGLVNQSVQWTVSDQQVLYVYAGPDASICEGNIHYISESAISAASHEWTGGDGHFETQYDQFYYFPGDSDIQAGTVDLCLTALNTSGEPVKTDCMTLTINPLPEVSCPGDMLIQFDELPLALAGATPEGGFYSGAYVENNVFNPQAASIFGLHNVYYAYASEFGCMSQCVFTIRIDTVPPVYLNDILVQAGEEHCHGSANTILTENYVVEAGASVSLASAMNVTMLPGTHVRQGAYLHAFIDSDAASFCAQPESMLAAESKDDPAGFEMPHAELSLSDRAIKQADFILYPNPTSAFLTLELLGGERLERGMAEVYNLVGERITSKDLAGKHRWIFDLAHQPSGVYVLRVIHGDGMHAWRVIKR